jgi:hypothetical protein
MTPDELTAKTTKRGGLGRDPLAGADGMAIQAIAPRFGIARNTMKKTPAIDPPARYQWTAKLARLPACS